jgi:hypothetical protein
VDVAEGKRQVKSEASVALRTPCRASGLVMKAVRWMTSKHQGGKNPSGYTCPKRRGKRTVQTYLEPPLYAAMQEIAARLKITLGDAFHRACREFARRNSNQFVDTPASYDPLLPPRTRILIKQDLVTGDDPGDVTVYKEQVAPVPHPVSEQSNGAHRLAHATAG